MEISDNMVKYVVIGAVLITLIIVTRGAFIARFIRSVAVLSTWIMGGLATLTFVVAAIFVAIPDPLFLEVWMSGLGILLAALAKFAYDMGDVVDPRD